MDSYWNLKRRRKTLENEGFKRISQIGIVVKDIEKASAAWADLLGVEKPNIIETEDWEKTRMSFRGKPSKARAKLAFFNFENITLELIEPVGGPSTWQDFAEKTGGGIHHLGFNVEDLEGTLNQLEEKGIEVEQKGEYKGGCYIYVNSTCKLGGIIELLHSYRR